MKAAELRTRSSKRAKQRLIEFLLTSNPVVSYADVYSEFLSLPIVEKADLDATLRDLAPSVQLKLDGPRRKTPSPFKNDIVIVDRKLFMEKFRP
jgi:hypothetical protein